VARETHPSESRPSEFEIARRELDVAWAASGALLSSLVCLGLGRSNSHFGPGRDGVLRTRRSNSAKTMTFRGNWMLRLALRAQPRSKMRIAASDEMPIDRNPCRGILGTSANTMKCSIRFAIALLAATLVIALRPAPARADDATNAPAPPIRTLQLREQFRGMSVEERRAKLLEFQHRRLGTNALPADHWGEQFKNLTPEERRAQLQALRAKANARQLDAGERAQIIAERRANMEARLAELQKKAAEGTLTSLEQIQLRRFTEAVAQFKSFPPPTGATNSAPPPTKPAVRP
jgi:hypothetical protein